MFHYRIDQDKIAMKHKVSLVLSGGGARGMAHIGVIEELEKRGFEIIAVAGTSMGSLVGGIYALEKMPEFKNWLLSLDKKKIISMVDFTLSSQGLIKGDKVMTTIKEFIPDTNIESLRIPYAAVAADIINNKEVVFTKGSLYDAIRASIAIPTFFTPVKTSDGLLVDGGVLNNIPVSHAKRSRGDMLVVVDVNANVPAIKLSGFVKEKEERASGYNSKREELYNQIRNGDSKNKEEKIGYIHLLTKTITLMISGTSQLLLEKFPPDIMINISKDSCSTYDFLKAEEIIEIGRIAAAQTLDNWVKKGRKKHKKSITSFFKIKKHSRILL